MPLSPGIRLGAYEIVAPLGAGGMGEVYKARDTRLDRIVALKILTGALADDPDARHRFEQEARAIAALNHPHICTIHDVGRQNDVDFLVMEHLEGETLAERLRGPAAGDAASGPARGRALPIDDALAIAIQIADALDAAHRLGIVHRDLKPGNVMLVRGPGGGRPIAKLLDFGLAAAAPASPGRALDVSMLATTPPSMIATRPPTASAPAGFSGTVQYMAPEQIDGAAADHRVDIFAFGCVLYEMLAGRRAFEGASAMAVMAAVMSTDPPPIPGVEAASPLLHHLVRRCLEKDPFQRWQHMGDVAGELRWIASQPLVAGGAPAARRRLTTSQLAAALIALAAVAAAALFVAFRAGRLQAPPAALPAVQFEVATPPTDEPSVALSPDGRLLAFVANRNRRPVLWVRRLDTAASWQLPGTEGASFPFWSPDNRTIGFFAGDKLKRIDIASGTPIVVTDAPSARGGAWGPGGVILFAPGVSAPIMRVPAAGGTAERVTRAEERIGHRWPQFLPDGTRFLFHSSLGTSETNGTYIGFLDRSPSVRVLETQLASRFVPPDWLLTVRGGALVAYRFDQSGGKVEGEPAIIAQGFAANGPGSSAFSTSDTGVLAYRPGATQRRQLVWVNRQGQVLASAGEPSDDLIGSPELSPDERSIAVFFQPRGDNEIAIIDQGRGIPRLLTNGPPADAHPLWDPGGRTIVFTSARGGRGGGPLRVPADGSAEPSPLFPMPTPGVALSWTMDGRFVLLRREGTSGSADLVAVSADGRDTIPLAQTPSEETEGQFSPDGRWVAFVSSETGRAEVYLRPFPGSGGRVQLSTAGGAQVRWSRDGKEIFYVAPDGKMMAVALVTTAAGAAQPSAPRVLFETFLATGTNVIGNKAQYAVARDGRFLLNTAVETASAPIIVTLDWLRAVSR